MLKKLLFLVLHDLRAGPAGNSHTCDHHNSANQRIPECNPRSSGYTNSSKRDHFGKLHRVSLRIFRLYGYSSPGRKQVIIFCDRQNPCVDEQRCRKDQHKNRKTVIHTHTSFHHAHCNVCHCPGLVLKTSQLFQPYFLSEYNRKHSQIFTIKHH